MIALILFFALQTFFASSHVETITYSQFKALAKKGLLSNVVIGEKIIRGEIKPEGLKEVLPADRLKALNEQNKEAKTSLPFTVVRVEDPELISDLEKGGVPFKGEITSDWLPTLLSWVVPVALFLILWSYLFKRIGGAGGGLMQIGKSKAKVYIEKKTGVTFADVEGIDEAEEELIEVVEFLKNPQKYQRLGGHIPKGVLLLGPPGTGKTLLARAVAGEAGVPFFSISGSDFVEMFVGVGAARVRDLFAQAVEHAPSIIFIDELDALGKARGMNLLASHDEREQTLNQLLAEMDGFDSNQGVIIMAATNRPEILDAALLRPADLTARCWWIGRTSRGAKRFFDCTLKRSSCRRRWTWPWWPPRHPGSSAPIWRISSTKRLCWRRVREKRRWRRSDFDEAIERVVAGLQKKSRVMNPREKKTVAYHEAGHALVAELVPGTDPVNKISIIPRGVAALGYTQQLPTEDRYLMTRSELTRAIYVLLGGRVAEEMIFDDVSTGAQNDLQKATEIARTMVTQFGMSERFGLVALEGARQPLFLARRRNPPKNTAKRRRASSMKRSSDC